MAQFDYSEDPVTIAIDRQLGNFWLKSGHRLLWKVDDEGEKDAEMQGDYDPVALIDSAIDQKYHFYEWYEERYINNHNGNNGGLKCTPLKTLDRRGLIRR